MMLLKIKIRSSRNVIQLLQGIWSLLGPSTNSHWHPIVGEKISSLKGVMRRREEMLGVAGRKRIGRALEIELFLL